MLPAPGARARCRGTTDHGTPCRNYAVVDGWCRIHAPADATVREQAPEPPRPTGGIELLEGLRDALGDQWLDRIRDVAAFLRRRLTGDYEVDAFGFDEDFTTNVMMPLLEPLHRRWWRVSSLGAEHLPDGGGLVVANHAGTLPADALMTRLDIWHQTGRHTRELGADLVFRSPVIGHIGRKTGATLAKGDDARRLLTQDALLAVFPEGIQGLGKLFRQRYQLQRFGRGGFVEVSACARTRPSSRSPSSAPRISTRSSSRCVSSSPLFPLGLPYLPITPTSPSRSRRARRSPPAHPLVHPVRRAHRPLPVRTRRRERPHPPRQPPRRAGARPHPAHALPHPHGPAQRLLLT